MFSIRANRRHSTRYTVQPAQRQCAPCATRANVYSTARRGSAERQVRPANAACRPGTKMNYVEVHGSDALHSHVLHLHRSPEPRGRVLLLRVDARYEHLALGATTSAFCSLAVFADGRRRRWHAQALTARRGHILCKAPGLQTVRHGPAARRRAPRARKARVAVIGRRFGRGRPREEGQRWQLFGSGN